MLKTLDVFQKSIGLVLPARIGESMQVSGLWKLLRSFFHSRSLSFCTWTACQLVALKLVLPDLQEGQDGKCDNEEQIPHAKEDDDVSSRTDLDGKALTIPDNDDGLNSDNGGSTTPDKIHSGMEIPQYQLDKERAFIGQLQHELDELKTNIRVFGMYRVTKSFNARSMCAKRAYQYLIPIKYLMPVRYKPEVVNHPGYKFYFDTTPEERSIELISIKETPPPYQCTVFHDSLNLSAQFFEPPQCTKMDQVVMKQIMVGSLD